MSSINIYATMQKFKSESADVAKFCNDVSLHTSQLDSLKSDLEDLKKQFCSLVEKHDTLIAIVSQKSNVDDLTQVKSDYVHKDALTANLQEIAVCMLDLQKDLEFLKKGPKAIIPPSTPEVQTIEPVLNKSEIPPLLIPRSARSTSTPDVPPIKGKVVSKLNLKK